MALSEVASYKLQATIARKYKPLFLHGKFYDSVDKSILSEKRKAGACNIDLWLNGSLYPIDPHLGKKPTFQSPSELLEFVGDGELGLLGYVKRLESMSSGTMEAVKEREIQIAMLRSRIDELICSWGKETSESQAMAQGLRSEICSLHSRLSFLQEQCYESLNNRSIEISKNLRLEVQLKEVKECHDVEMSIVKEKLNKTSAAMRSAQGKLQRMKKNPYGIRSQIRTRRDVFTLAANGGHTKAIRRLARLVVAPDSTGRIQRQNLDQRSHKRLCGSKDQQIETGKVFASLLSKGEVSSMLESPSLRQVGINIANNVMNSIGDHVESHAILKTCDENGITQKGYGTIFKKFKGGIQAAGKGLKIGCLPNLHRISMLRKELNGNMHELVGEHYWIHDCFEVAPCIKAKKKEPQMLQLHEFNNLFVDVEAVQRTMIHLYEITTEDDKVK